MSVNDIKVIQNSISYRHPGKHIGIKLKDDDIKKIHEFSNKFPDNQSAREWFEEKRWGKEGQKCPHCGYKRHTKGHKSMPYRCAFHKRRNKRRECGKEFSVRTNTILAHSNVSYHKWLLFLFIIQICLEHRIFIPDISGYRVSKALKCSHIVGCNLLKKIYTYRSNVKNETDPFVFEKIL